MYQRADARQAIRVGFTLVELAVVLLIILILSAITAGVVARILEGQERRNTETNVSKLLAKLRTQWQETVKEIDKEPVSAAATALSGSDPRRARAIHRKLRLRQEFPMSFAEIFNTTPTITSANQNPLGPQKAFVQKLTNLGITTSNLAASPEPHESAACLLLALQRAHGGASVSADDLGNTVVKPIAGANGVAVPALVDGWGAPLAFYRWPTGNAELDAMAPTPLFAPPAAPASIVRDPQDPEGTLLAQTWYNNVERTTFENVCHSVTKNGGPYAYHLIPVIASAGPDAGRLGWQGGNWQTVLGLSYGGNPEPMTTGLGGDNDNIYSYRLSRTGGRGD